MKRALAVLAMGAAFLIPVLPASASTTFDNCDEAFRAGRANIPASDPAYRPKLDRDKDGIACEDGGAGSGAGGNGDGSGQADSSLPKTGGNDTVWYGVAGAGLIALGAPFVVYRRRMARHARP